MGQGGEGLLVVYALAQHPLRSSVADHLYSFRRHSRLPVTYFNAAVREAPRWMRGRRFDAILFHTSFLSARWDPETFGHVRRSAQPLLDIDAPRLAMPQDEFIHTDALADFVREASVSHIYSVADSSQWPLIYSGVDLSGVEMHRVLTGYLEAETLARIERALDPARPRSITIGYRAWEAAMWLGRHGRLKADIAEAVRAAAAERAITVDISTSEQDTILGDDWHRFLAGCAYTIGVEGGATVLDRDGSIRDRTEAFLRRNPAAAFETVEAACFPGEDGRDGFRLTAISPRHLEACATRTCQILVEGDYNGILEPDVHYLPLRPDLSNLDEVLDEVSADDRRAEIVERAWRDVAASGRYTYAHMVREVELTGIDPAPVERRRRHLRGRAGAAVAAGHERRSWRLVRRRVRGPLDRRFAESLLPGPLVERLAAVKSRLRPEGRR